MKLPSVLTQLPPRHSSGSRTHSSTSGHVEERAAVKAWTRAGRGRAHGSCPPPLPTHTPALPRRAWRLGAPVREFELKGAGASQPKKEAGIRRTVRAMRLTFLESPKETLRSHPVAQSPGIRAGSGLQLQPPQAPVLCPSFHPSGPPQGLGTCCSPFRPIFQPLITTFSPTLSATTSGPPRTGHPWGPHPTPSRSPLGCFSQWPFCMCLGICFRNIGLPIRS